MRSKGDLYPHVYDKLITKELFDKCQDVRFGRKTTKYKRTMINFTFRGMLKCSHCGCSYSPELQKKKYIYMRPTKCHGKCEHCFYLKEETITNQISDIIKQINIPENILEQVKVCLKDLIGQKFELQMSEMNSLKLRLKQIKATLDRLVDILLSNSITQEDYDRRVIVLKKEENEIANKLEEIIVLDNSFENQAINLFKVANKSYELFKSSEPNYKRQIISLLFSNLSLDGEKLVFTLQKPFDKLVEIGGRSSWLPDMPTFLTNNRKEIKDFNLIFRTNSSELFF